MNDNDYINFAVAIKEQLTEGYNALIEVCALAQADGQSGALASLLHCPTQEVNTWADVFNLIGPDAVHPTDPLKPSWWRAITRTDSPKKWLAIARDRQLTDAEIRREASIVQQREIPTVLYDGGATVGQWGDSVTLHLDSVPPDGARPGRVRARIEEKC